MRIKIFNWIYFIEFRREKEYGTSGLTKKEYQNIWLKKKLSKDYGKHKNKDILSIKINKNKKVIYTK